MDSPSNVIYLWLQHYLRLDQFQVSLWPIMSTSQHFEWFDEMILNARQHSAHVCTFMTRRLERRRSSGVLAPSRSCSASRVLFITFVNSCMLHRSFIDNVWGRQYKCLLDVCLRHTRFNIRIFASRNSFMCRFWIKTDGKSRAVCFLIKEMRSSTPCTISTHLHKHNRGSRVLVPFLTEVDRQGKICVPCREGYWGRRAESFLTSHKIFQIIHVYWWRFKQFDISYNNE